VQRSNRPNDRPTARSRNSPDGVSALRFFVPKQREAGPRSATFAEARWNPCYCRASTPARATKAGMRDIAQVLAHQAVEAREIADRVEDAAYIRMGKAHNR